MRCPLDPSFGKAYKRFWVNLEAEKNTNAITKGSFRESMTWQPQFD